MTKRLMPILLASVLCIMPPAALGHVAENESPIRTVQTGVAVGSESGVPGFELTDIDREAFQLAEQSSDPDLGEQRGGFVGFLILVLVIVLIVVLVD
jgi:hypothetical protein